jgi:site-specific DNA recombinase
MRTESGSMLTVAYCRVSTEEQAAEGFSISGQADRLQAYAELHELGAVTVIDDGGWSGKNLERPGLRRLLEMVEAGHVSHVLVWRLDRLSRDLGDLVLLADKFGLAGVALHSFTEKLDLSSATGRMFYNILGSFAQFYREQLVENVRMGTKQAVKQGRWVNRPKTGYSLIGGRLSPNEDADRVRSIFRHRAEGLSYQEISDRTGINYSTVGSIIRSRIYLGEVLHNGEWFPGIHEPIVTEEEFAAAHRGHVPGRRRGSDLLSGRVFCGLCGKRMAVEINGDSRCMYRCRSRGSGCTQPRRTNVGLHRAAVLGLALVSQDKGLQEAIRGHLAGESRTEPQARRRSRRGATDTLAALSEQRRKVLDLYYGDQIGGEFFAEEEKRISGRIEAIRGEVTEASKTTHQTDDVSKRFEEVLQVLTELDIASLWKAAEESERRVLVEELLQGVSVFPDHLEVTVAGVPRLNVTFGEVGLKESQNIGVGGGT